MSDAHRAEIAKLEALYAENPEGRLFTHLAEAYRKDGQLTRAHEVLAKGIERHPDYSSAHVVLGRVLMDQGRFDEATTEFHRVLEFDEHNLVALGSLGEIARVQGRDTAAIEYFERLLELDPSSEETKDMLAELRAEKPAAEAAPGASADAAAVADGPSGETVAGLEPTAVEDAGERGGAGEPLEGFERADDDAVDEAEAAAGPVGGLEEVGAGEAVEDAPWATSPSEEEDGEDEIVWLTGPEAADPDATESAEVWEPELVEEAETRAEADEASVGSGAGETGAELPRGPGPEPLDAEASPWAVGGADSERDEPEAAEPVGESAEADAAAWQEPRQEAPLPDEPGVMTETFAYVYARQGLYERAAEVYRELIRQRPDDDALRARLAEMEELAAEVRGQEAGLAADGDVDGAEELEGFESSEVDAGDVEAETLAGFEPEEVDYDTGLSAETTAGEAEPEPFADAVEVRDVPAPPEEEAPWGEAVGAAEEAVGAEDEAVSVGEEPDHSPWTADDWSSPTEETPYAWAADETEDDTSPPIHDYLTGLLDWSGGAAVEEEPAAPAEEPGAPEGPGATDPWAAAADDEAEAGEGDPWAASKQEAAPPEAGEGPGDAGAGGAEVRMEPAGEEPYAEEAVGEERRAVEDQAGGEEPAEVEPAEPGRAEPRAERPGPTGEDDEDDDLDMFRSWLESLKQ